MRHHIKSLSGGKIVGLVVIFVWMFGARTQAQNSGFGASVSPVSGLTNTSFTYTMGITNLIGAGTLQNVFVTNVFSSDVQIQGIGSNYSSTVTTFTSSNVVFRIPQVNFGTPAVVALSVTSSNAVPQLTNFISFFVGSPSNSFATNLVIAVTNIPPLVADLAVSIAGPGPDVYVGDWITFGVTVTNLGPNTASSIVLSNSFQSNGVQIVAIKSISPTNQFSNGVTVLSPFTLTNKGSQTFRFTVSPTNAGALPFSVSLTSDAEDSNSTNNTASTNILVSAFLTNSLVATALTSTQKFNAIIGVMEQRIALSNASPGSVPSARVKVSGIPAVDRLYNAVGTNEGNPFVVHGAALNAGESVNLVLQYKVPSHQQLTNLTLEARAMTNAADLTPPANLIALNLTNRISRSATYLDTMLIEFSSTNGRSYTVVYDDNIGFSNPKVVRPSIIAPANWTYWMDFGPPATISSPSAGSRFYKIYLNP